MSIAAISLLAEMTGSLTLEQKIDVVRLLRQFDLIPADDANRTISALKRGLREAETDFWNRRQQEWDAYQALPRYKRLLSMPPPIDPRTRFERDRTHWDGEPFEAAP